MTKKESVCALLADLDELPRVLVPAAFRTRAHHSTEVQFPASTRRYGEETHTRTLQPLQAWFKNRRQNVAEGGIL